MARGVKVKLNHSAVQDLLNGGSGIDAFLRAKAEAVLKAAQADPHDDTGAYEAGLHIEEGHTDRLVVRVVSGDWKGHILEAKYGILARALDAAGGD
ncbi:MAG: hypothetical protein HOQ21_05995 [Dermatophilaceae bacterium]|nr:hypothetical protein [Dermatophilaceae bacterium]